MLDNDCNTQQAEKHIKRLLWKELETYHKVRQSCFLPSIPFSSIKNSLQCRELFFVHLPRGTKRGTKPFRMGLPIASNWDSNSLPNIPFRISKQVLQIDLRLHEFKEI